MILSPKMCSCGCKKVILEPLCGCQCSSVLPEEAHELMVKVNYFDDVFAALKQMYANANAENRKISRATITLVNDLMAAKPKFDKYPWAS